MYVYIILYTRRTVQCTLNDTKHALEIQQVFQRLRHAHTAAEFAQDVLLGARHTVLIVGALRRAPTAVDVIVIVIGVAIRRLRRHDVTAAMYLLEHAHQQVVDLVVQDGRHFDAATLVVSGSDFTFSA